MTVQPKMVCRPAVNLPLNRTAAIGNLCVHWTMLEYEIEKLIWLLSLKGQKAGRAITHKDNFPGRVGKLSRLMEMHLRGPGKEALKAQIADTKLLYKERNLIVHGFYGWPKKRGMRRRLQVFSFREDPLNGHGYEATVDLIDNLTARVDSQRNDYRSHRSKIALALAKTLKKVTERDLDTRS